MFSKIASAMTIFMMVFSMVGPMNARAQEVDPEILNTISDVVVGCMDETDTNYNATATEDTDPSSCEEVSRVAIVIPDLPDLCENIKGIQIEIPNGMEADGDYCYTPKVPEEGMCQEGDETYTSVYFSNEDTQVNGDDAVLLDFIHTAWTAVIDPMAEWIWSTNPVVLVPEVNEVEIFTKTFEVTGTPTSANLMIAADNFYSVDLNGEFLCSDLTETNFNSGGQDNCIIDVTDLDNGTNTLEFTVNNMAGDNATDNPAGLMYKLTVNGDCETCELTNGWAVDYFNYLATDVGMNLPVQEWYKKSTYGNPLSANNTFVTTADAWTGWSYADADIAFSQVESDLMFGASNFFPFDSGAGLAEQNESLVFQSIGVNNVYTFTTDPSGTDYHFGLHAKGFVDAPVAGNYAFTLTSDDDVWIYVNGVLVVDNSGVHGVPGTVTGGNIALNAGVNEIDLYYAERHAKQAALNFEFTDKNLVITTNDDCVPPPPPPVDVCPLVDGIQTEGPCKNDSCETPAIWNEETQSCETLIEPLVCNPEVNLLANGGFEAPALSANTWSIVPDVTLDAGSVLEWLVAWIGTPGTGALGLEIQNNVAGAPASGSQHAELDGDHPVTIWQDIPTIPGATYKLDFKYSGRPGVTDIDNSIQAKADGVVLGADLANTNGTGNTIWSSESRTFVADSNTKIEFYDNGTDTSLGGYLDDVSLTCVPEPIVEMCEYDEQIPADSDNCVPPPTVGNIVINKYECPADTVILRSVNGVNGIVPAGCVTQAGATFGIVHGEQTDAIGPYPELDAVVTNLEISNGSGVATFAELSPAGRYLVVETDSEGNKLSHGDILGLFCEGDGDTSNNNDNQELTFVEAGENSNCIAYNKIVSTSQDETNTIECSENQIVVDNECVDEPQDETPNRSSSGSRTGGSRPAGAVLGATTDICAWDASFMRRGYKGNKSDDVKKVQQDVANGLMQVGLVIDGVYGPKTEAAIKAFQAKYADEILKPWGINTPTGLFYLSSLRHAQKLLCPTVSDSVAPIPNLIPWSKNPNL